jgi:hypothetical protein
MNKHKNNKKKKGKNMKSCIEKALFLMDGTPE